MDVFNWTLPVKPVPTIPRTYYAKRLLEHGPLSMQEFRSITGWKGRTPNLVLWQLKTSGVAEFSEGEWRLTDA